MISVIGGLWVMSGPLAAQVTTPSANRSLSSSTVMPGGEVTVSITVAEYGGFGSVTETLPAGFTYVSSSLPPAGDQVLVTGQDVEFTLQGDESFTYLVTAPSMEGSHSFSGNLRDSDRMDYAVGGESSITVSTDTGPTAQLTLVTCSSTSFRPRP